MLGAGSAAGGRWPRPGALCSSICRASAARRRRHRASSARRGRLLFLLRAPGLLGDALAFLAREPHLLLGLTRALRRKPRGLQAAARRASSCGDALRRLLDAAGFLRGLAGGLLGLPLRLPLLRLRAARGRDSARSSPAACRAAASTRRPSARRRGPSGRRVPCPEGGGTAPPRRPLTPSFRIVTLDSDRGVSGFLRSEHDRRQTVFADRGPSRRFASLPVGRLCRRRPGSPGGSPTDPVRRRLRRARTRRARPTISTTSSQRCGVISWSTCWSTSPVRR